MRSRVRSGGRERSTDALIVWFRDWVDDVVKGEGGARSVGEGSIGAVSIGEAAVEACRWAERQLRQREVDCGSMAVKVGRFPKGNYTYLHVRLISITHLGLESLCGQRVSRSQSVDV